MSRRRDRADADGRAVRAAAVRTAWQIAAVSAVTVLAVLLVAVLFVLDQSTPSELLEAPRPGETKIYVDASKALAALVVLGMLAVTVVGLAAWRISRRAVAPLGGALRIQRAFVADASHELRMPLTVLDTRLQILERKLARHEPAEETLSAARRDTRVMIDLVADLLLVAEASAAPARGAAPAPRARDPGLRAAVQDLGLLAERREVGITAEVGDETRVPLSESSLRRCLVVLIDNALSHSPPGSRIGVAAAVERSRAVVRVTDEGSGIAGIAPDRIFERFARGDERATERSFGIGLALVRDLTAGAGGSVLVERTSSRGTTMRLELPVLR